MKTEVNTIREIFTSSSSGRQDWHFAVRPGDGTVEILYLENDVAKSSVSIEAEAASVLAEAICQCGDEVMRRLRDA